MSPRAAIAAALLAVLAGCGSSPGSRLVEEAYQASVLAPAPEEGAAAAPTMTREIANSVPWAIIGVRLPGQEARGYLVASAAGNGNVAYVSAARRGVILRGDALAGTRGLGVDLVAYRSDDRLDPLVTPRPPADWPEAVTRVYRFRDGEGKIFSRAFACAPRVVGPAEIEVLERTYRTVEIEEACGNARHRFVNRYWVSPETGRARRSLQWMGPEKGSIEIDIVRRFRG